MTQTQARPPQPQRQPEAGGRVSARMRPLIRRARPLVRRLRPLVRRIPPRLRFPVTAAGLSLFLSLIWWAAFYPGLMSYDSFTYTWESTTGHWINDHSIPYLGCVWLTLQLTGDYALLTFCQIVALALAVGYLAAGLRTFDIRRRWILAAVALYGVLPPTGDFFVFVWKDVPFALGGLLCLAAVVHLVGDALRLPRGERRLRHGRRREWWVFGLGALVICLARNNGFLTVLLLGVVLLACLPWRWRVIAPLTVLPVLFYFLLTSVVYPAVGVQKQVSNSAYSFFYADVAYGYSKNTSLYTQPQLRAMAAVARLEHWRTAGAQCWDTDILTASGFSMKAATAHDPELMSAFTTLLRKAPQYVADAQFCRSHQAWAVFPDHGIFVAPTGYAGPLKSSIISHPELATSPFRHAFTAHPLSYSLNRVATWWAALAHVPQLTWLFWSGAAWCYLAYALVVRLTRRIWRREVLAVAATTAAFQLTVLAATPAPLYRYMATPTVVGVLLLPLAFSRLRRRGSTGTLPEQPAAPEEPASPRRPA
ncbi:DUF2079 domain-containing protein [Streptacidiphilus cavernicola]|uniref:DUF2079 domain-containing protein n=1 Tax=Streptacidiphilus cavernicola TaxID=3342716 RepID=A0ABV6VZ65_9ACTN